MKDIALKRITITTVPNQQVKNYKYTVILDARKNSNFCSQNTVSLFLHAHFIQQKPYSYSFFGEG